MLDLVKQAVVGNDHAGRAIRANRTARQVCLFGIGDQDRRIAVANAQLQRVRPEQGEHRHRDRAGLHRAEQADIERQRRLKHEGDAVALLDALRIEPVGELRRTGGDLVEAQEFVMPISMGDPHRGAARAIGMAGDAFVGDVEVLTVAIEQVPQRGPAGMRLGIGIAGVVGESGHATGLCTNRLLL